jgi:hypothetical protein
MMAMVPMASAPNFQITLSKPVNFTAFPTPFPVLGKSRK